MKLRPWSYNCNGLKRLRMSPSTPHAFAAKFMMFQKGRTALWRHEVA
jgi:hypothetical protein